MAVGNGAHAQLIHCRRRDRGCLVAATGRTWRPRSLRAFAPGHEAQWRAEFRALAGRRPRGRQKQYCYIQTMATGTPLRIPPRQETHYAPVGNRRSIRGDCDPWPRAPQPMVPYCVYTADLRRIASELGRAEVLFRDSRNAIGRHQTVSSPSSSRPINNRIMHVCICSRHA